MGCIVRGDRTDERIWTRTTANFNVRELTNGEGECNHKKIMVN